MASASSRAYKLQLSAEGVALFLRCHDRLCRAVGDLLPYGSTLFVAVAMLHGHAPQDMVAVLEEPDLQRLGGKTIRYVGTSTALSSLVEEIAETILEAGSVSSRPQVWKIFLAALSAMQDADDGDLARSYVRAGLVIRADGEKN